MTLKSFTKAFLRFILKTLSFLPALIIMYCIYSFSAQNGTESSNLSNNVSFQIVYAVDKAFDLDLSNQQMIQGMRKINHYVRKMAHFTEYFLLAISVSFPLYVYGIRGFWLIFTAGFVCVGFASLDEFHQLYVSGRSGSRKDVMIDSLGSLTGIIFTHILCYIGRKTIFEPLSTLNKQAK